MATLQEGVMSIDIDASSSASNIAEKRRYREMSSQALSILSKSHQDARVLLARFHKGIRLIMEPEIVGLEEGRERKRNDTPSPEIIKRAALEAKAHFSALLKLSSSPLLKLYLALCDTELGYVSRALAMTLSILREIKSNSNSSSSSSGGGDGNRGLRSQSRNTNTSSNMNMTGNYNHIREIETFQQSVFRSTLVVRARALLCSSDIDGAVKALKIALRQDPDNNRHKARLRRALKIRKSLNEGKAALSVRRFHDAIDAFTSGIEACGWESGEKKREQVHGRQTSAKRVHRNGTSCSESTSDEFEPDNGLSASSTVSSTSVLPTPTSMGDSSIALIPVSFSLPYEETNLAATLYTGRGEAALRIGNLERALADSGIAIAAQRDCRKGESISVA